MERFVSNTESGETPDKRVWHAYRENHDSSDEWMIEQEMVRETLSNLNEDVLFEILAELAGKAGIDIRTIDLLSLEQIKIVVAKSINSIGLSGLPGIVINEAVLPNDSSRVSVYRVLWATIHEYLHQLSTVDIEEYSEITNDTYKSSFVGKTGVQSNSINSEFNLQTGEEKKEKTEVNKYINEGVTEWLTGLMFDEYVKRTGETQLRSNEKESRVEGIRGTYWVEKLNVELYMIFLSELSQQPISVIENSVIRTYLRNGEIIPEEILDLLNVIPEQKERALINLKETINKPDFAEVLVALKNSLPKERRELFYRKVVEKFNLVGDAIDVNNKKHV